MPIADVDYKDTGCRYYPSCLNCGEPDECKLVKKAMKLTLEERRERKRIRDKLSQARRRERLRLEKEQLLING